MFSYRTVNFILLIGYPRKCYYCSGIDCLKITKNTPIYESDTPYCAIATASKLLVLCRKLTKFYKTRLVCRSHAILHVHNIKI